MATITPGLVLSLSSLLSAPPAEPAVVPRPAEVKVLPAQFRLSQHTIVLVDREPRELVEIGEYLADDLRKRTGFRVPLVVASSAIATLPGNVIVLTSAGADEQLGDDGYELNVAPEGVTLRALKPRGLFWGVQTLRQIVPVMPHADHAYSEQAAPATAPAGHHAPREALAILGVNIVDQPRYAWRGMLLDSGRHFMPKDFVKRYIDLLAYHKMNVLHWHLTEDQGWRIEIKKYPKLTEIGAWRTATRDSEQPRDPRGRYGGYYTQEDIREIVAHARSRFVTIVPEIEMPGHSLAALAAYPELSCTGGPFEVGTAWGVYDDVYCAGSDRTFEFLEGVLSEVVELFPSEFIHIGGDECPKVRWQACDKCQARMKAEGLKDEHELQSWFIRRIEKFLAAKGRRLIGWDEILEGGLPPNATVQSWRGMSGAIAAATSGHDVIASPNSHCYLDYPQMPAPDAPGWMGVIGLQTSYSLEPTPPSLTPAQSRHILGIEGNMWTERTPPSRVDQQVFPRLCALAEVGWTPKERRDWGDFVRRMDVHFRRLEAMGVTYFIPPPFFDGQFADFVDRVDVVLTPGATPSEIRYTLDGSEPGPASIKYEKPIRLTKSTTVAAKLYLTNGSASDAAWRRYEKLEPLSPMAVDDPTAGLAYEYFEGDWSELPELTSLMPLKRGTVPAFGLEPRQRDERFALRLHGYFDAPKEGLYAFHVGADDYARLTIGPPGAGRIIECRWPESEHRGRVLLKAGRHPIELWYVQLGGDRRLQVQYEAADLPLSPIPETALLHKAD